jgi:putative phosphoribosyl transferase
MVKFKNREEALKKLFSLLDIEMIDEGSVILAISKKGVYYATELAKRLGFVEADFLFSEPIISPINKNCVLGCISETKDIVLIDELIDAFGVSKDYIYSEAKRLYDEKIINYMYEYRYGDSIMDIKGKKVLLVDEGANTGLTLEVAIESCLNYGAKKVDVAIPLMPKSLAGEIKKITDYCYFVYEIENFIDIDFYFEDRKNIIKSED